MPENELVKISIIDAMGKAVKDFQGISNTALEIKLSVPGIYIINVTTSRGIYMKKLIVE